MQLPLTITVREAQDATETYVASIEGTGFSVSAATAWGAVEAISIMMELDETKERLVALMKEASIRSSRQLK